MVNNVTLQNVVKVFENATNSVNKAAATEKALPIADRLDLSAAGIDIQSIKVSDIPQVSQQKLDELRDAIASGTYKIDYEGLAEAIMQQNITES